MFFFSKRTIIKKHSPDLSDLTPNKRETIGKCETWIILKLIKIFKSPARSDWLKTQEKSTIVKISQRPEDTINWQEKRYAIQRVNYLSSTQGAILSYTYSLHQLLLFRSQSYFMKASFRLFSAPWKPQGCHGSCYQGEGSEKILTTLFLFLMRCKDRFCPLCLHRHCAPLCS